MTVVFATCDDQPLVAPDDTPLASQVMTHVGGDCVFARVDIVEADRGPLLMELELIEPELYFTIVPGSAARMARAIAARLS